MASYSRSTFMGRIATDVEISQTGSGTNVLSVKLAVDRNRKNKDGEKETDFHRVIFWDKLAEFVANNFKKGDPILVDCVAQNRTYTDKDGNQRSVTEFVAREACFVEGKRSASAADSNKPMQKAAAVKPTASDDALPEQTSDDELPF